MKFYLAGGESFADELRKYHAKRILVSYYYIRNGRGVDFLTNNTEGWDIFLDCGAYSAWTRGDTIDVHAYAKFLKDYGHLVSVYPNLDVKGSIEKTLENQTILEGYGLHPIPVFHVNTRRWDILEDYIERYPYIALGAVAGENTPMSTLHSDMNNIFARMKKKPYTKFHGFGITSLELIKTYPFYSVDSTNWLAGGRFGTIYDKLDLTKKAFKRNAQEGSLSKALNYKDMMRRNVQAFMKLEKDITYYWKMRGVDWNE